MNLYLLPTRPIPQIEAHEFTEQRLHMHFAAALTALQARARLFI